MASPHIELFPADQVPGIIADIQTCCESLRRKSQREHENHLSKRLASKLRCIPRYIEGPLEPHWESNIDESSRVDFRFSCAKGIETYFAVEAKRLFVGRNPLISKYIAEGMMRFVSGKYSPHQREAAMLGYVFDAEITPAKEKLKSQISRKGADLKLTEDGAMRPAPIPTRHPVDQTIHLSNQRAFTIYHILTKV